VGPLKRGILMVNEEKGWHGFNLPSVASPTYLAEVEISLSKLYLVDFFMILTSSLPLTTTETESEMVSFLKWSTFLDPCQKSAAPMIAPTPTTVRVVFTAAN